MVSEASNFPTPSSSHHSPFSASTAGTYVYPPELRFGRRGWKCDTIPSVIRAVPPHLTRHLRVAFWYSGIRCPLHGDTHAPTDQSTTAEAQEASRCRQTHPPVLAQAAEGDDQMQLRFPSWPLIAPAPTDPVLRPGQTTCDDCGELIPLTNAMADEMGQPAALVTVKHTDGDDIVFHFCDETCANNHYLERLREGM